MLLNESYRNLFQQLSELYDTGEAKSIAAWVIENITGYKRVDITLNKQINISDEQNIKIKTYTIEVLQHKPVQYVLHEAWFAGLQLYVDKNVLIPRSETEELVNWINDDCQWATVNGQLSILDVGTGSGCIAIALKNKLQNVELHALDISFEALEVAQKNAGTNNTHIHFHRIDILNEKDWKTLPEFDIIVSNPPYVKRSEAIEMHKNVVDYEPHLALFVENEDALIYYKAIIKFAKHNLKPAGKIFFEINESAADEIKQLLTENGYDRTEVRKDIYGKWRMVKASK